MHDSDTEGRANGINPLSWRQVTIAVCRSVGVQRASEIFILDAAIAAIAVMAELHWFLLNNTDSVAFHEAMDDHTQAMQRKNK